METKQKRKYNLFWLIFWIIVCFPVAYYYYFKKQYPNKKILKESPQKYIFIGLIVFYVLILITSPTAEQQTAQEQQTQERIEKSESEITAEELIRDAEELRDAKEKYEMSDEFKSFSEACQAGCESMFPTDDMEYTECVVTCVLG